MIMINTIIATADSITLNVHFLCC